MITYDLVKEGAWDEVVRVAALRQDGKENRKWTKMYTSGNPHIIGCAGEMAFELATGYDMDRNFYPGGDGGWDFTLPAGTASDRDIRVDVKTRTKLKGSKGDTTFWLKDADLYKKCDLFVLCTMERTSDFRPLPMVTLTGVINQETVRRVAEGKTRGYDLSWTFKLSQSLPIEALFMLDKDGLVQWTFPKHEKRY